MLALAYLGWRARTDIARSTNDDIRAQRDNRDNDEWERITMHDDDGKMREYKIIRAQRVVSRKFSPMDGYRSTEEYRSRAARAIRPE